MQSIGSLRAGVRAMGWAVVLLAATGTQVGAQVPPPPPPQPVPGLMFQPDPRQRPPAPRLPHELRPEAWPQPDYFQSALGLTARKPRERAASLRLRLAPGQPSPAYLVLPVQIQAFGFDASFRAMLGAELDLQLDRAGLPASTQTDAVDAHGPFVRRLDDAVIADLLRQHPSSQAVLLHAGHDGFDTLFLTLVLRDAKGQRVAHRSLPLAEDALQALRSVAEALPALMKTVGLPVQPRPVQAGTACEASAWKLENPAPLATSMQKACLALAAGSLLPGSGSAAMPSTEARLAWLARAHAQAGSLQPASPESTAIVQLARTQLGLPGSSATAGLIASKDPVVSRVARLHMLPLLRQSPVQSERDAIGRQVETLAEGLPALARAAVEVRAAMADPFAAVDLCALERHYPGAMLSPACRQQAAGAAAPARPASRAEFLLFQEWRIAAYHRELQRLALTLGQVERARALIQSLPADVAAHPFMQRLLVIAAARMPATGSYDDLLRRTREETGAIVSNMVDVQRHDGWVFGHSLSEHTIADNTNITMDPQIQTDAGDDSRLLGVLKYDRFVVGPNPPYRRKPGTPAYFLRPEAGMMKFELSELMWQQAEFMAPVAPPAAAAPAAAAPPVPWTPPPLFGTGQPLQPRPSIEEQARQLAAQPSDMDLRVDLALRRALRGGSVAEALALIEAQPVNRRSDERVSESHRWAAPAHSFFFAAEPEAARRLYEKVVAIGSGSDSDLMARARVLELSGRSAEAFAEHQRRQQRYDSDFTRRDVAAGLFMTRQSDAAWRVLMPRAAMSEWLSFWDGVMVGHRMAGLSPAQAGEWLQANRLDKVQIDRKDLRSLYPLRMAVVDRVPNDADIELLRRPAGSQSYVTAEWAMAALLVKTSMSGGDEVSVHKQVLNLRKLYAAEQMRFMLAHYVPVAWKATQGKDDLLAVAREADMDSDFDGLLAKSVVLAFDGRVDESLRYLTAARFSLGFNRPLLNRPIPTPYQWALSATLMHARTGNEAYRKEILRFARAYQRVFPFLAWPHALEAWMAPEPKARHSAACRAQFLDPNSHFLQRAAVPGLTPAACKSALW
jgi:hypothetical protein